MRAMISDILRGLGVPPVVVGFARALVEVALIGAALAVLSFWVTFDFTVISGVSEQMALVLIGGGRVAIGTIIGILDGIDPAKRRAPAD